MTTFHTPRETDGVPAPADCELAAMGAANAKQRKLTLRPHLYDFNDACTLLNVNYDREQFHRWCRGLMADLSHTYNEGIWRVFYGAFLLCESAREHQIRDEDDRDLHDTQQDSIAPPW